MADQPSNSTDNKTTRRAFGKKAYMAPAILAAIKATESVANAQAPFTPPTVTT